jgi:hypothetical protein
MTFLSGVHLPLTVNTVKYVRTLKASHLLIFEDAFALLVSIHVLHVWYALDHSENLQLYHYQHHQRIDSVYSIYVKLRFSSGDDTVKPLLKLEPAPAPPM